MLKSTDELGHEYATATLHVLRSKTILNRIPTIQVDMWETDWRPIGYLKPAMEIWQENPNISTDAHEGVEKLTGGNARESREERKENQEEDERLL